MYIEFLRKEMKLEFIIFSISNQSILSGTIFKNIFFNLLKFKLKKPCKTSQFKKKLTWSAHKFISLIIEWALEKLHRLKAPSIEDDLLSKASWAKKLYWLNWKLRLLFKESLNL